MSNPYHDPQTGEFTDGPGGAGTGDKTTDHAVNGTSADRIIAQNPNRSFSIAEKRALNDLAFHEVRFTNKIAATGAPQAKYQPPFPGVERATTPSQRDAMIKASNKLMSK